MNDTPMMMANDVAAENETEAAILSRRAVRGFLPTPVDRASVEHLLNVAARAPSGTNMQPWRVVALAGAVARVTAAHPAAVATYVALLGATLYYALPLVITPLVAERGKAAAADAGAGAAQPSTPSTPRDGREAASGYAGLDVLETRWLSPLHA